MNSQQLAEACQLIRNGQWNEAHEIVQTGRDPISCWIHGWLHRQEGDESNARYWYSMADRSFPEVDLDADLEAIESTIASSQ